MSLELSIIIPVYNSQKYLDSCLASVCNQIKKNVEVILINDFSKDFEPESVSLWAKDRQSIKYFSMKNYQNCMEFLLKNYPKNKAKPNNMFIIVGFK